MQATPHLRSVRSLGTHIQQSTHMMRNGSDSTAMAVTCSQSKHGGQDLDNNDCRRSGSFLAPIHRGRVAMTVSSWPGDVSPTSDSLEWVRVRTSRTPAAMARGECWCTKVSGVSGGVSWLDGCVLAVLGARCLLRLRYSTVLNTALRKAGG